MELKPTSTNAISYFGIFLGWPVSEPCFGFTNSLSLESDPPPMPGELKFHPQNKSNAAKKIS